LNNLPSLFCLFLEDVDVFELFWPSGSEVWLKLEESAAGCKKSFAVVVLVELLLLLVLLMPVSARTFGARGIFTTTRGSTTPMLLFLLQKYMIIEIMNLFTDGWLA
jgi:hypothetical protein